MVVVVDAIAQLAIRACLQPTRGRQAGPLQRPLGAHFLGW